MELLCGPKVYKRDKYHIVIYFIVEAKRLVTAIILSIVPYPLCF